MRAGMMPGVGIHAEVVEGQGTQGSENSQPAEARLGLATLGQGVGPQLPPL